MICKNCGEQNEVNSKFCIKCGATLEEQVATPVEPTPVQPVQPTQPVSTTNGEESKKDNKALIIILSIVGGIILLGIIGYFTVQYLIGMFVVKTAKTIENGVKKEIVETQSKYGTEDQMFPDFKYEIPAELVPASYNSKTLGFFKNTDTSNRCNLTLWNVTYIPTDSTAESMMASHSSIGTIKELKPTTTKINGKEWTTYSTERYGTKYNEYGRFSNDGKTFYLIKYADYKPATGVCDKYLNKFLKTVKSK